jgi:ABC-type transporter Mla MlaB component
MISASESARAATDLIVLDGVFDDDAARRLEDALDSAGTGARVRLDLSRVRELHDHALALLAKVLAGRADAVRVAPLGLRRHQLRLLRYLGVDAVACERELALDS